MRRRIKREETPTSGEQPKATAGDWPRALLCPHCKTRQLTKATEVIDKTSRRCIGKGCGAALTTYNEAPPPEDAKPAQDAPKGSRDPIPGSGAKFDPPLVLDPRVVETVTVTWGQETFTPKQFHSFHVGPFNAVVALRPGETRGQALARGQEELREFAEKERTRKAKSFIAALGEMYGSVKTDRAEATK